MERKLPPPILNKRQNWALVSAGAFGNKLRHWRSYAEVIASGWPGPVSLRCLQSCWPCKFDLSLLRLEEEVRKYIAQGGSETELVFNEGAPDEAIVVQGELFNEPPHHARVSFEKVKMREALRRSYADVSGWRALEAFRSAMTPSSADDFAELLELYPYHVFEVSVYSRCLGDCRGRNALIWEIRRY